MVVETQMRKEDFWENILLLYNILLKGQRCGPTNRIVNDSNFKPSKFDCQFRSYSDSNKRLYRQLWFLYNFIIFLIKIDCFGSLFDWKINRSQLKDWKSWLKDWKSQLKVQKINLYQKSCFILTFLIIIDLFPSLFDLFWYLSISFRSLSISFWSLSISFRSLLIDFDHFDIFRTENNQFVTTS